MGFILEVLEYWKLLWALNILDMSVHHSESADLSSLSFQVNEDSEWNWGGTST